MVLPRASGAGAWVMGVAPFSSLWTNPRRPALQEVQRNLEKGGSCTDILSVPDLESHALCRASRGVVDRPEGVGSRRELAAVDGLVLEGAFRRGGDAPRL